MQGRTNFQVYWPLHSLQPRPRAQHSTVGVPRMSPGYILGRWQPVYSVPHWHYHYRHWSRRVHSMSTRFYVEPRPHCMCGMLCWIQQHRGGRLHPVPARLHRPLRRLVRGLPGRKRRHHFRPWNLLTVPCWLQQRRGRYLREMPDWPGSLPWWSLQELSSRLRRIGRRALWSLPVWTV